MLAIIMIINVILDSFLNCRLVVSSYCPKVPALCSSEITNQWMGLWGLFFFIMLKTSEINLLQIYTVFLLFTPICFLHWKQTQH